MIFGKPFEVAFDEHATVAVYKTYSLDLILANVPRVLYTADSMLGSVVQKTYLMSARMGVPTPEYFVDSIIILDANDPILTDSFVNCLMWAFANEWRKAARSIELLSLRMKLDYANTEDLDDHWGVVLGLKRRSGESNDTYRTRLATYIRIITSNGTKSNCQTVIDRITGAVGGSRLETFGDAEVVLSWTSPDAIEAAIPKALLISEAMDSMLAAGVTWYTSYSLVSYSMDLMKTYMDLTTYTAGGAIGKKRGYNYYGSGGIWESGSVYYDIGSYIYSRLTKIYQSDVKILGFGSSVYYMQSTLQDMIGYWRLLSYESDAYNAKNIKRGYTIGGELT